MALHSHTKECLGPGVGKRGTLRQQSGIKVLQISVGNSVWENSIYFHEPEQFLRRTGKIEAKDVESDLLGN